jgi:hypothetical protein
MTAIDWQQIIGDGVNESFWRIAGGGGPSQEETNTGDLQVAYDVLAARVPQACPTCDVCRNGGYTDEVGEFVSISNPCPDCPTVAKLLAIGAAVMTWPEPDRRFYYEQGQGELLDHMRAVEP